MAHEVINFEKRPTTSAPHYTAAILFHLETQWGEIKKEGLMRSSRKIKKVNDTTIGLDKKIIAFIAAMIGIVLAMFGWFVPDLINNIWPEFIQKIPHDIWNLVYFPIAAICALLFSVSWLFFVLFLKKLVQRTS